MHSTRLLAALASLVFSGCAATTEKGFWGGAAHWPNGAELQRSAADTVRSPHFWAPLAAAAVLALTGADDSLSERAARNQPLFGSDASAASDDLRAISKWSYIATALIAPDDTLLDKGKGLAVGIGAAVVSNQTTRALKSWTDRTRPDGSDNESFPSGHTSAAATWSTLAVRNVDYIAMPDAARQVLQASFYGIAGLTGWARVEAEKHHVTDVLAGYALGHLVAGFAQQAFLEVDPSVEVGYLTLADGGAVTVKVTLGAR